MEWMVGVEGLESRLSFGNLLWRTGFHAVEYWSSVDVEQKESF